MLFTFRLIGQLLAQVLQSLHRSGLARRRSAGQAAVLRSFLPRTIKGAIYDLYHYENLVCVSSSETCQSLPATVSSAARRVIPDSTGLPGYFPPHAGPW